MLKKPIKRFMFCIIALLALPLSYVLIALLLSTITIERKIKNPQTSHTIYLHTNGVHLDITVPKSSLSSQLLKDLPKTTNDHYFSFGWGDENFYLNTPTWNDLTFNTAVNALFFNSNTLMHVTRYQKKQKDWLAIKITDTELNKLNDYLLHSFQLDTKDQKIILTDKGYTNHDDFYKAKGHYSLFKTCNTWVNLGFKESGLKASYWTAFDFGLLNKYDVQ